MYYQAKITISYSGFGRTTSNHTIREKTSHEDFIKSIGWCIICLCDRQSDSQATLHFEATLFKDFGSRASSRIDCSAGLHSVASIKGFLEDLARMKEKSFEHFVNAMMSDDLSLTSELLFEGDSVKDFAYEIVKSELKPHLPDSLFDEYSKFINLEAKWQGDLRHNYSQINLFNKVYIFNA